MSNSLHTMARWARGLTSAPDDVLRIARLQHLAAAGAVRRCGGRVSGGASEAAGVLARWEWDDFLLTGRTGLGALPAVWARAPGHTVNELLLATVIGNEIGGRVGLTALFGPRADGSDARPVAAAAAAAAWLDGLDADAIAGAVAAAVEGSHIHPFAERVGNPDAFGRDTVAQAVTARGGDPTVLDRLDAWTPLSGADAGLGVAWLTHTLVLKAQPGSAWTGVAVEAVGEILDRHVRAAEKRLRCDQVERVEISVGTLPAALERASDAIEGLDPFVLGASIKRSVGALVAFHELTPEVLADVGEKAADIEGVASRIELLHDWKSTLGTVESLAPIVGPLGVRPFATARRLRAEGMLPGLDIRALIAGRADRVLRALRAGGPALSGDAVDAFRWRLPVAVKLYTTRGGWWPERRSAPRGTVGGGDMEAVARARFGGGEFDALLDGTAANASGADWVARLGS